MHLHGSFLPRSAFAALLLSGCLVPKLEKLEGEATGSKPSSLGGSMSGGSNAAGNRNPGGSLSNPTAGSTQGGSAAGAAADGVGGNTVGGDSTNGGTNATEGGAPNGGGWNTGGSMTTGGSWSGGATGATSGGSSAAGALASGGKTAGGTLGVGGKAVAGAGGAVTPTGGTSTSVGGTTSLGGSAPGTGGSSSASGGAVATGGSTNTPTRPPGYFYTSDWGVKSADWHGCAWIGLDSVAGSTTMISAPATKDYTTIANGGPYRIAGTLYNSYEAVAMLGFNLNEAITGSSTQCNYNAAALTEAGPPAATIPTAATGIAVNWSVATAPNVLRIQIQGADSATNPAHRWCATITDAGGPSFIPFAGFYTNCWNVGVTNPNPVPVAYAGEAIDRVVFLVPGTMASTTPFDVTVVGFAPGTSKADAPGAPACGTTAGTLGSATASATASMQRAKVSGSDCKQYIVSNNNSGQPTSTTQVINYTANRFTVQSSTAATAGQGVPGSFPSIYIGANGNIANGTYSTWADSGLPKPIDTIASVQTSFTWSGGSSGGDYNATYNAWFAQSAPTAGSYNDAVSGLLAVWLYRPGSRAPIGSVKRTATIAGHTWNVWVGPIGSTSAGTDGAGRPVVSYVAQNSPIATMSFDLKAFIDDAVTNGAADMSAGGTSQAFTSSWYLTDVFAGFEIWTGSAATGLTGTFACAVN